MIDTLKQRLKGRSNCLEECLDAIGKAYWLYLGFSADDLLGNPDYLGLRQRAGNSLGGTYLLHPREGGPQKGEVFDLVQLKPGPQLLMRAHAGNAQCVADEVAPFIAPLLRSLSLDFNSPGS